jgi:hypothetical protein
VDVVSRHPALVSLGRDPIDQRRATAFAVDLARWLVGRPREELRPLARVVTVVAQRELRPTRLICRDRPLLSVEAAARATVALWPLLRDEPDTQEPEEPGAGASEGEGEESPPDPLGDLLGEVAAGDDPDLDALMDQLRRAMGAVPDGEATAEDAACVLDQVSMAAAEGAIATDRAARHLERFLPGIGWSTAPGQLEVSLLERLDQLTKLLAELPGLEALADALGRLEDASERDGRREGGREELVGVRLGGEVASALPAELALLGDPDTEDLFYQRLLEKRLVSLELTGTGDEGRAAGDRKGPVIACIDTSASMEGAPELCAKALVLAVCRQVIPRGRTVHLVLFGGPGERTEIRLRRGLGGLEGMLAFLQQSFHSGTDFDGPLLRAMELLDEQALEAADVLVVTDGLCRAAPDVIERVHETRARVGVRVWSVVLGHDDTRGVEPFSDEVLQIDPNETAGAARTLRSIAGSRRI